MVYSHLIVAIDEALDCSVIMAGHNQPVLCIVHTLDSSVTDPVTCKRTEKIYI